MRSAALIVLLSALCACSRAPAPADVENTPTVPVPARTASAAPTPESVPAPAVKAPADAALTRFDGYGDLRFGMTADEARKAWGGELKGDTITADTCGYLVPKWAANGSEFGFMFESGKLVRYDVGTAKETAPEGGKVGMMRARIESLYSGRLEARPHEYVPGGQYLRIPGPAGDNTALVFETDGSGRVTRWRIGRTPQVDYVEGCS